MSIGTGVVVAVAFQQVDSSPDAEAGTQCDNEGLKNGYCAVEKCHKCVPPCTMRPKGSIVVECGNALLKNGYKVRILNTINFKKSMHYNPFAYVHSEKDILKLVTTLMTNTKGEGSGGDPFWEKSERLLLTALIAYLHYEAPVEEQNFATLLEMLNTMQVLEDDEEYQNPVDLLFEELAKKKPNSFAGRQYKLYKLAAGVT